MLFVVVVVVCVFIDVDDVVVVNASLFVGGVVFGVVCCWSLFLLTFVVGDVRCC